MFVSGFTIARNAVRYDYPVVESIHSLLPLVDEMIVAIGDSDDGTRESILEIHSKKIRILDTVWDEGLRRGGMILAQQTNLALSECTGDWCFYLQADEVIHERDYDRIRRAMKTNIDRRRVEGLSFRYHHFRANYDIRDPLPYRRQVRIVRSGVGVRSCGDACGFEVASGEAEGRKLRAVSTGGWIYHYGWVKPPVRMSAKLDYFKSLYDGRKVVPGAEWKTEDFQWDLRTCERFMGTHPQTMDARIAGIDWKIPQVSLVPRWRNWRFWKGLAMKNSKTIRKWIERLKHFQVPNDR